MTFEINIKLLLFWIIATYYAYFHSIPLGFMEHWPKSQDPRDLHKSFYPILGST